MWWTTRRPDITIRWGPFRIYRDGVLQFAYDGRVVYHNLSTNAETRAYNIFLEYVGSDDRFMKTGPRVVLKSEALRAI